MIRDIHVTNFKSLRDVSFSLGPRNVLVGRNMAGKSNIVSLFRFLKRIVTSSPGSYGLQAAVTAEGGFAQLAWRGDQSNLMTIGMTGDLPLSPEMSVPWQYRLEILGDRQYGLVRVQDETLTITSEKGELHLIVKDPGTGQRALVHPDRGQITHIHSNDRSALEFEVPDWPGNEVRAFFASMLFYKLIPALMKQSNTVGAPAALDETGSNLSAWLMVLQTRHSEDFARLNSAVADALPDVARLFTWPTAQSTVFLATQERAFAPAIGLSQMSDGELCFIALLSLIFSPEQYGAPVICVEEPENHLHPGLIHALVDLVNQRQRELGQHAAQLVVTTHSPQLLDRLGLDDIVLVNKTDGETRVTRPQEKAELRDLLAQEELGLGDLFYSGLLGSR